MIHSGNFPRVVDQKLIVLSSWLFHTTTLFVFFRLVKKPTIVYVFTRSHTALHVTSRSTGAAPGVARAASGVDFVRSDPAIRPNKLAWGRFSQGCCWRVWRTLPKGVETSGEAGRWSELVITIEWQSGWLYCRASRRRTGPQSVVNLCAAIGRHGFLNRALTLCRFRHDVDVCRLWTISTPLLCQTSCNRIPFPYVLCPACVTQSSITTGHTEAENKQYQRDSHDRSPYGTHMPRPVFIIESGNNQQTQTHVCSVHLIDWQLEKLRSESTR